MRKLFILYFVLSSAIANANLQICPRMPTAAAVTNQWINSISASGAVTQTQPAFSNISGTASLTSQVTGTLPTGNGGTGVASVTTSPTASSFAGWDANSNLSANNHIESFTSTATAAGTTTLVVGSTFLQFFTGSTTQTAKLPVATTLVNGQQFLVTNLSSGVVTVQSSGSNTLQALAANTSLLVTCINTAGGTGTASWSWTYLPVASNLPMLNPMTTSGDTIYGGASGAPTALAANATATKKYLQSVSSGVPSWVQVAAADLAVTQTQSNNGYVILPGGVYINWLSGASSSTGGVSTNWTVAFPTACQALAGAVTNATNVTFRATCTTSAVTLTVSSGTPAISVIAIGY